MKTSLADLHMRDYLGINRMDDNFKTAVSPLLKWEGGYSNNPNDPGGPTDYGISLRFLRDADIDINEDGWINIDDIHDLTEEKAISIYKQYWWDKYDYDSITSVSLAAKILNMAVNMGAVQAHKIVQRSCTYCGHRNLSIDGILGKQSFYAINEISEHGREDDLMDEIVNELKWFYEHIVEEKPKFKIFLKGWLRRASWRFGDPI